MKYTAEKKAEYEKRFREMKATSPSRVEAVVRLVQKGEARYKAVEKLTGVPWAFIGLCHYREAACDFRGVLHNGEKIVGTGRKTVLEPKGYGPFATWEDSAVSALRRQKLHENKDWSDGKVSYLFEGFNGYGYQNRGVPSPYLYGGTNQYVKGKYIRDHVFDPNHVDQQLGILPAWKVLKQRQAPGKEPAVVTGATAASASALYYVGVSVSIIAALAVLALFGYVAWKWYKSKTTVSVGEPEVASAKAEEGDATPDLTPVEVKPTEDKPEQTAVDKK